MNSILKLPIICFFLVISCNNTENKISETCVMSLTECELVEDLSGSYFKQINENLGLCITQNKIYFLTNSKKGFKNNTFMLHFINEDNSFINKDFKKEKYIIKQDSFKSINGLQIISVPIINKEFKSLRTGQYKRNADGSTSNIWVEIINFNDVLVNKYNYKNEFINQLSVNIVDGVFLKSLKTGVFFKNAEGFYILYDNDFIYFIGLSLQNFSDKFLLHFITKDNTFVNESFFAKDFFIQSQLNKTYKDIVVVRKRLIKGSFEKIRIGQYNSKGNIWMQEFEYKKLKLNPLLIYNNEFLN